MDTPIEYQGKKPLVEVVAENVRRRVKEIGGQTKFAQRAGVSQSTVSRVTNIGQKVTLGRLELLAKGCGCEPYQLLIDSERMRGAFATVERILQPLLPAPAAPAPENIPASRKGTGEGKKAVEDSALRSQGEKQRPATARAEKFPNRRKGIRRVRRGRQ